NYPITKSADNRDYLKIASTGERSVAGSIFMDYRNTADFSDRNTIIYGHNMKNGSMFGTLDAYEDKKYWEDHPKIYIFTETTTYVYEIYTAAEISANVDYYKVKLVDDQAYANYLTATVGNALYETGVIPTIEQKILTLSTCTTNHKNRFVIQGVLLEEG
ncbi:MAG: class B sortase, partial [Clostridiales bacterium]